MRENLCIELMYHVVEMCNVLQHNEDFWPNYGAQGEKIPLLCDGGIPYRTNLPGTYLSIFFATPYFILLFKFECVS